MLEYVFFNAEPRERFSSFLREQGIEPQLAETDMELLVQVEEAAVDDELADTLDSYYDEMFALDRSLYHDDTPEGDAAYEGSGVVVNLKDGTAVYADVPPALLSKVMDALTLDELADFVNAIVDAVENPDPRSFCQRLREGGAERR